MLSFFIKIRGSEIYKFFNIMKIPEIKFILIASSGILTSIHSLCFLIYD